MSLIGFCPVYDAEREEKSDSGAGTSYWSCEDEEDP
jgi:Zn-finger protein